MLVLFNLAVGLLGRHWLVIELFVVFRAWTVPPLPCRRHELTHSSAILELLDDALPMLDLLFVLVNHRLLPIQLISNFLAFIKGSTPLLEDQIAFLVQFRQLTTKSKGFRSLGPGDIVGLGADEGDG